MLMKIPSGLAQNAGYPPRISSLEKLNGVCTIPAIGQNVTVNEIGVAERPS